MKCLCCDRRLTDYEATRRHAETKEFLDLCNRCFHEVGSEVFIPTTDRKDLLDSEDIDEGLDNDNDDVLQYNFKEDVEDN